EDEVTPADFAPGGAHSSRGEAQSPRILVDARAGALRGSGQPERVVERMEMTAIGVVEGADVALGGERRSNFLPGHVAHSVVQQSLLQLLELPAQLPVVARLDRSQHVAVDPVAVDAIARNELAHEGEPFDGDVPDCAGGCS